MDVELYNNFGEIRLKAEIEKAEGGYVLKISGFSPEMQAIGALDIREVAARMLPLMTKAMGKTIIFVDFKDLIECLKESFGEK